MIKRKKRLIITLAIVVCLGFFYDLVFHIDDLDFKKYDIIYLEGGWGAAYDLGYSTVLGKKISEAYAAGKVIGGFCHGPLGLLLATDEQGNPLVAGAERLQSAASVTHQWCTQSFKYHASRCFFGGSCFYRRFFCLENNF